MTKREMAEFMADQDAKMSKVPLLTSREKRIALHMRAKLAEVQSRYDYYLANCS